MTTHEVTIDRDGRIWLWTSPRPDAWTGIELPSVEAGQGARLLLALASAVMTDRDSAVLRRYIRRTTAKG
jgi:hypothetical protein